MRRLLLFIVVLLLGVGTTAFAQSQEQKSLGDAARENRNASKKPSARVYTDENFSKTESVETKTKTEAKAKPEAKETEQDAVEGDEDSATTEDGEEPAPKPKVKPAVKTEAAAKAKDSDDKSEPKPPEAVDKAELAKEVKTRVAAQRGAVELIEREISVMEREYKLRASSYYADAGLRLRDDRRWQEDEKKYNAELDAKKQKLAKAKDELNQIIDLARRAGINGLD
jgi:cytoskeletal protein RodZ